jgi:hypothetical protein
VTVTVTQSGAAPGEMETQVTRPIEDAVASISNVKTIRSSVVQGASTTTVEFEIGEDLQKVTDEVRSKVDQTRALLPREVDEPIVQRLEITSAPIITYAVSAPNMSATELSWFIDDTVTRALQGEKGVAQVARVGGVNREINVIIDPDRMAARRHRAAAEPGPGQLQRRRPRRPRQDRRPRADPARAGRGHHGRATARHHHPDRRRPLCEADRRGPGRPGLGARSAASPASTASPSSPSR